MANMIANVPFSIKQDQSRKIQHHYVLTPKTKGDLNLEDLRNKVIPGLKEKQK